MNLLVENLRRVNEYRQGKHYYSSERLAATEKRGASQKQPLGSTPYVVVEFQYAGTNIKGYWRCDQKVLELEDCAGVVKVLHPEYDCIFLFDHSCGNDTKRDWMVSAPSVFKRNTEEKNHR